MPVRRSASFLPERPVRRFLDSPIATSDTGNLGGNEQRAQAKRTAVSDSQVRRLLAELLSAPGDRLDTESAASALGIAAVQLPGALPQCQRLLNVEQYAVLSRDPDGNTVVLDTVLLTEQFDVSS